MDIEGFRADVISPLNAWLKTDFANECLLLVLKRMRVARPELSGSLRNTVELLEGMIADGTDTERLVAAPLQSLIQEGKERHEWGGEIELPIYDPDAGVSINPDEPGYKELKRRLEGGEEELTV